MQVAEVRGPQDATLTERPEPTAAGDIVKVATLVIPMCTEWRDWQRGQVSDALGHEAVGVVVDAAASTRVRAGDRVAVMPHAGCGRCPLCRAGEHIHCTDQRDLLAETGSAAGIGTYAEYLLKPDYLILPVPDDLPLRHAAMAVCGLGPTFTAMRRMNVSAGDTVLVSGCGAVGLGAIVNARAIGARVIALELQPYRAALAGRLGAEIVLDPRAADVISQVLARTGGAGADASVETSNNPAGPPALQAMTRPRGRIAIVSWAGDVQVHPLVGRGHDIFGCWHWNHQVHGTEMISRVRQAAASLDMLATHSFPLSRFAEAFALQHSGACGKVLLYPDSQEAPA